MYGINAVKDKHDSGMVKFANPFGDVKSSDFALCLSDAQKNAIVDSFSSTGPKSLENISSLLPTRQNVEVISEYMQKQIKDAFIQKGISEDPPVSFKMDQNGNIQVSGDRSDLSKIESMFDSGTPLGRQMHDFMAMASEMPKFERAMEYTEKYEQATSKAEIDALNREYADLFDGKDHSSVSFSYGSTGLDVDTRYMA